MLFIIIQKLSNNLKMLIDRKLSFILLPLLLVPKSFVSSDSPWSWYCNENVCSKVLEEDSSSQTSLSQCLLTCSPETVLWPLPQNYSLGKSSVNQLQLSCFLMIIILRRNLFHCICG